VDKLPASAWLECAVVKKRQFQHGCDVVVNIHIWNMLWSVMSVSARLECVWSKLQVSAWLECAVVENVSFITRCNFVAYGQGMQKTLQLFFAFG
jgi:hypothetical protein